MIAKEGRPVWQAGEADGPQVVDDFELFGLFRKFLPGRSSSATRTR